MEHRLLRPPRGAGENAEGSRRLSRRSLPPTNPPGARYRVGRVASILGRASQRFVDHEGFELSGYAAFTALLSLFPFLLFLTALAGFLGSVGAADSLLANLFEFAPREVVDVLRPPLIEVLTQRHGGLLTASILFALWSASSGIEALRTILNRSYGITETRPIWRLRPQSILLVVGCTVFALMASSAIIFGAPLLSLASHLKLADAIAAAASGSLRYGVAGVLSVAVLSVLHLALPNARLSLRLVMPGAVITVILWISSASLFSIYVENFANFSITYGSLGGIILTLLFFYVTAILFAWGAELNAALQPRALDRTLGAGRAIPAPGAERTASEHGAPQTAPDPPSH